MIREPRHHEPTAGHDWALWLYDPFTRLLGIGRARRVLVEHSAIVAGQRVLDLGCGTGSLVVELAEANPRVEVVGIDPDPKSLARARRKAERAGTAVQLDRGFADALPYPDASFDRVLSSFMFHHVPPNEREAALREVVRVLKPGGRLHLLDFSVPKTVGRSRLARAFHMHERLRDNVDTVLLGLMGRAGLVNAIVDERRAGMVFSIAYYRASAPRPAGERASD